MMMNEDLAQLHRQLSEDDLPFGVALEGLGADLLGWMCAECCDKLLDEAEVPAPLIFWQLIEQLKWRAMGVEGAQEELDALVVKTLAMSFLEESLASHPLVGVLGLIARSSKQGEPPRIDEIAGLLGEPRAAGYRRWALRRLRFLVEVWLICGERAPWLLHDGECPLPVPDDCRLDVPLWALCG